MWILFFLFFFYPPVEVVTFRLRGWCMLGVFLLTAFTRLGHECQDLLSPCDGVHVCTDQTSVYTLIRKSFCGMEPETVLTLRKNTLYRRLRGASNTRRCTAQASEPNTLPTELFLPLQAHWWWLNPPTVSQTRPAGLSRAVNSAVVLTVFLPSRCGSSIWTPLLIFFNTCFLSLKYWRRKPYLVREEGPGSLFTHRLTSFIHRHAVRCLGQLSITR